MLKELGLPKFRYSLVASVRAAAQKIPQARTCVKPLTWTLWEYNIANTPGNGSTEITCPLSEANLLRRLHGVDAGVGTDIYEYIVRTR